MHKFKLIKNENGFRVQFVYRKEVIFWTESYTKKASAMKAINSLKDKALAAEIEEVDETIAVPEKAPIKKGETKKAVAKKPTTKKVAKKK
ncbi:MAG: DUF1508 domain-containing protein [Candidatus Pacebacteria bacterium]|nr:DUF1508 domain-containing protein [Candidatus Paceibacterota bacterium]